MGQFVEREEMSGHLSLHLRLHFRNEAFGAHALCNVPPAKNLCHVAHGVCQAPSGARPDSEGDCSEDKAQ